MPDHETPGDVPSEEKEVRGYPPDRRRVAWMERKAPFLALPRAVIRQIFRDRLIGLSAEIAFYELMAMFPFLIVCVAVLGLLPAEQVLDAAFSLLGNVTPAETVELIRQWLLSISRSSSLTLLSMSALVSLWMGSIGIGAYIEAFWVINRRQGSLKLFLSSYVRRLIFTFFGVIGLFLILTLWVIAPPIVSHYFHVFGIGVVWRWSWFLMRVPLALAIVVFCLTIFYHFLGASGRKLRRSVNGAVVASIVFWISSILFSRYLSYVGDLNATFGSLGGVILLMLWFQILNLSVLLGEVVNVQVHYRKDGAPILRRRASDRETLPI